MTQRGPVHHVQLGSRGERRWCRSWIYGSDANFTTPDESHGSDVEHGSTREVYDGSTVCIQADVHTAAGRHNTSGSWYDVMDPLEQPRQRQLQRDDSSGGIDQPSGDDPSDDDDATLENSDLDRDEQQSTVLATTVKDRREHSKGY